MAIDFVSDYEDLHGETIKDAEKRMIGPAVETKVIRAAEKPAPKATAAETRTT